MSCYAPSPRWGWLSRGGYSVQVGGGLCAHESLPDWDHPGSVSVDLVRQLGGQLGGRAGGLVEDNATQIAASFPSLNERQALCIVWGSTDSIGIALYEGSLVAFDYRRYNTPGPSGGTNIHTRMRPRVAIPLNSEIGHGDERASSPGRSSDGPGSSGACTSGRDCTRGHRCEGGECVPVCRRDEDCARGEWCRTGHILRPDERGGPASFEHVYDCAPLPADHPLPDHVTLAEFHEAFAPHLEVLRRCVDAAGFDGEVRIEAWYQLQANLGLVDNFAALEFVREDGSEVRMSETAFEVALFCLLRQIRDIDFPIARVTDQVFLFVHRVTSDGQVHELLRRDCRRQSCDGLDVRRALSQ